MLMKNVLTTKIVLNARSSRTGFLQCELRYIGYHILFKCHVNRKCIDAASRTSTRIKMMELVTPPSARSVA